MCTRVFRESLGDTFALPRRNEVKITRMPRLLQTYSLQRRIASIASLSRGKWSLHLASACLEQNARQLAATGIYTPILLIASYLSTSVAAAGASFSPTRF